MSVPVYIRFGVHKDRLVLKEARESFKGIIIPAHILAHTSDATRAAIDYIDRPYFIDPMTYIFTRENIKAYLTKDSDDKDKFKMSIEKMADEYDLLSYFVDRNYKALEPSDFDEDFIDKLCGKSIAFQQGKVNDLAETAFKKYSKILLELNLAEMKNTDHKPIFYTPPYFYSRKVDDEWHKLNLKLARKVLEYEGMAAENVAPILLTSGDNLTDELLNSYAEFKNIILWISDLDEASPNCTDKHIARLKKYKLFVESATKKGIKVTNLYGSYYSAILTKFGLEAFGNGIFYGEYKSHSSKIGGGAPPIRFYVSRLHRFYLIPTTLAIFNAAPELFNAEPVDTRNLLRNDHSNIIEMLEKNKHIMAQKHFLWARKQELADLAPLPIDEVLEQLNETYSSYADMVADLHSDPPVHLKAWVKALG